MANENVVHAGSSLGGYLGLTAGVLCVLRSIMNKQTSLSMFFQNTLVNVGSSLKNEERAIPGWHE